MRVGLDLSIRSRAPERWWPTLVTLMLCAVLAGAATAVQDPVAVAALAAVGVLCLIALWYPGPIVVLAMAGGVFAAYYITVDVPGLPFAANGPLLIACLLAFAAVGVGLADGWDVGAGRFVVVAAVVGIALFLVPLGVRDQTAAPTTLAYLFGSYGVDVAVLLAALCLCAAARGRLAVLRGFAVAGPLAAVSALVELVLGRNPILEFAVQRGQGLTWTLVPERFGLHRSAVGFGHPIELGMFLGLAAIATLELSRRKRLSASWANAIVAIDGLGLLATISRGPLLATVIVLLVWTAVVRHMAGWRRFVLLSLVVVCLGLTVWEIGFGGDVVALIQPSDTELGATTQHRVSLASAFLSELHTGRLFGTADPQDSAVVAQFGGTIDNEGLYLMIWWGLSGLVAMTLLLGLPAVLTFVSRPRAGPHHVLPVMMSAFFLLAGASVAFFGQLQPYIFIMAAVLWTTLAEPAEEPWLRASTLIKRGYEPFAQATMQGYDDTPPGA